MIDNRRDKRIAVTIPVEFGCAGKTTAARCIDISTSGMFIMTWVPLPEDEHLWVRFSLPEESDLLYLHGRVVWTKYDAHRSPCGMGVEFTRMSNEHRKKIIGFIEKKLAKRTAA